MRWLCMLGVNALMEYRSESEKKGDYEKYICMVCCDETKFILTKNE